MTRPATRRGKKPAEPAVVTEIVTVQPYGEHLVCTTDASGRRLTVIARDENYWSRPDRDDGPPVGASIVVGNAPFPVIDSADGRVILVPASQVAAIITVEPA